MDRRAFLRLSGFFTVSSAVAGLPACGGDDHEVATLPPIGSARFAEGVASGDPRPTSLVFWTRSAPASGSADVALTLDVASDAAFATIVASVGLTAESRYDFTVRHKLTGLVAGTPYWYRFTAGSDVSPVGRAKTAPAAASAVARLRFGCFTCQDWSNNHWQAMTLMANEDFDFIVHLGDFIYEAFRDNFTPDAAEAVHLKLSLPDGALRDDLRYAVTLADYRTLHRTYRSDTRLQALQAAFASIVIWDDHEFTDDAWQDHETYSNANAEQLDRRRAATQAWAEFTPIDWGDLSFDLSNATFQNIRIYRSFDFGSLMTLVMTDERLYRDDHVVHEDQVALRLGDNGITGDDAVGARYFVARDVLAAAEAADTVALGRAPQILGPVQSQWWKDTLKMSSATWKVWGNAVTLNRMWLDLSGIAPSPNDKVFVLDCDAWDGYPTHKADLLGYLKAQAIGNVVALTGDLHCFEAGVVRDNNLPTGTAVLTDFVTAGISSNSLFDEIKSRGGALDLLAPLLASSGAFESLMKSNNPDFAYVDLDAQGYASVTVTPAAMEVVFTKVKKLNGDGQAPAVADTVFKRTRCTVASGTVGITVVDGV